MIRNYTELSELATLEERFAYLQLRGRVGEETFGFERHANQKFYRSAEWQRLRDFVIVRDNSRDLGSEDFRLSGPATVHHMNPITLLDIQNRTDFLLDPEYLISASHRTHNAIHYGNEAQLPQPFFERGPGDIRPRRR